MSILILELIACFILVALWVNNNNSNNNNDNNTNITYFHSFGVEHIPKQIKKFIKNKNIKTNIFKIQA